MKILASSASDGTEKTFFFKLIVLYTQLPNLLFNSVGKFTDLNFQRNYEITSVNMEKLIA